MFENVHNTFQRLMRTLANMQNVLKVCLDQGRFGVPWPGLSHGACCVKIHNERGGKQGHTGGAKENEASASVLK